jgi:hypothetical protein
VGLARKSASMPTLLPPSNASEMSVSPQDRKAALGKLFRGSARNSA